MKTKYKILIVSILVLSMLTSFAITSFAYVSTDITYDGDTYTFNDTISSSYQYLQIWDYDSLLIYQDDGTSFDTYNYDYVFLRFYYNSIRDVTELTVSYDGGTHTYSLSTNMYYVNVVISGNFSYAFKLNSTFDSSLTNINNSDYLQYNVWYDESGVTISPMYQINLLNNNEPNPLDKVNDFLTYLSTSLNKLTTMIITNQILILFIVAVPVVSFVIGSFKRIKDAGRV